jgi:DNA-binding beta-propeller fold protein YncE
MSKRLALAICVFVVVSAAFGESKKALVLDSEAKSVTVVDAAAGTVGERVMLPDTPSRMVLSPDGKRIAVLSRGEGTTSFWTSHFNPSSKSSVTLIDAASMKQIARTELGWDLGRAAFSSDGSTLTVLTPGVTSNKPNEVKPAEVIRLNAKTGEVVKRAPLDRAADSLEFSSNGATGAIYFKATKEKPAEVRLIDVGTLDTVSAIPLGKFTDAPAALIKDRLYLVDKTDAKSGKMYIVSLADRKLAATLEAGDHPIVGAVDPEKGNIYLLNDADELKVVNGTTVSAGVNVAGDMVRFTDDKKVAYVIGNASVTPVDLTNMTVRTPIKIGRQASDFVASPDGRRGFVLHRSEQTCCRATVVDFTTNTNMKSFATGSKGARIAAGLAAAAATVASYQSGRSTASARGGGTFYYSVYTPRVAAAARGPMAIRRDGKFAYVLDVQTNDVTIIDGESGERLQNIRVGGGGHELVALSGGKYLAAVSDESVAIVDTETNQIKTEIKLSGDVSDFALSSKGDYAAVIGKQKIAVIDARTASQVATFDAFKRPSQFIFLGD